MFSGVWADDNFGSSTTLRIQSKAPSYTFTGLAVSTPNSVTLTLTDHLGAAGAEGDWELLDSVSPVMTEGARKWIRDLAGQFAAAGIMASFAFSMEVYNPPAAMRAKYLHYAGGVVTAGNDVFLDVPSYQMHFGTRVRNYLRQMYKECADEIAAAGLPVVLQFGETQWWYFDNRAQDAQGGMPFYDQETISAFAAAKGHQIWPFTSNTDDPAGDPAHPNETADFPAGPDLVLLPGRDLVRARVPSGGGVRVPVASRREPGEAVADAGLPASADARQPARTSGRPPRTGSSTSGARDSTMTSGRRTRR